jgi:hypothetical protein
MGVARRLGPLVVVAAALLLSACPFESKVPLGSPDAKKVDARLVGYWVARSPKSDESALVVVLPFNDAEYLIEIMAEDDKPERYRGFRLDVAGHPFLQLDVLEPKVEPRVFSLARYEFTPDHRLSVRLIGDKLVPESLASDRQGLLDFVAAHVDDTALYDQEEPVVLRRAEKGEIRKRAMTVVPRFPDSAAASAQAPALRRRPCSRTPRA